jgi:hypothetical protein
MPDQDTQNDSAAVGNNLTSFLMGQAKIPTDPKTLENHPRYVAFRRAAERVIKFLGSGDYLSLVAALDAEDDGTLLQLVKKANQNRRTDTTESRIVPIRESRTADRDRLSRQGFTHSVAIRRDLCEGFIDHLDTLAVRYQFDPNGTFHLDLRENRTALLAVGIAHYLREAAHTPVSRMVQNGLFADWIGNPEDLREAEPASRWYEVVYTDRHRRDPEQVVAVRESDAQTATRRATKHFKEQSKYDIADFEIEVRPGRTPAATPDRYAAVLESKSSKGKDTMRQKKPVTETVMGMTGIPGLNRMRELAGISGSSLDADFDAGSEFDLPAGHGQGSVSFEPDFEPEPAALPEIEPPAPKLPALSKAPAAAAVGGMSEEFRQATEALDRALTMVMNMKLSEYKLFCERASDFAEDVAEIGRQINAGE